jgi:p90 ribosomal S6 kinase
MLFDYLLLGKHYAMKIQTKKGLLECYSDDPWRADFEKQAFASCEHPFIVNLDYAFQTEGFAIMVLGLATAGDLQQALNKAPNECLPENRVQFYSAEIVLALVHLHQMGLMYRYVLLLFTRLSPAYPINYTLQ